MDSQDSQFLFLVKISSDSTRGAFWDARHLSVKACALKISWRSNFRLEWFLAKMSDGTRPDWIFRQVSARIRKLYSTSLPNSSEETTIWRPFEMSKNNHFTDLRKVNENFPKCRVEGWSVHKICRFDEFIRHSIFASKAEYHLIYLLLNQFYLYLSLAKKA